MEVEGVLRVSLSVKIMSGGAKRSSCHRCQLLPMESSWEGHFRLVIIMARKVLYHCLAGRCFLCDRFFPYIDRF